MPEIAVREGVADPEDIALEPPVDPLELPAEDPPEEIVRIPSEAKEPIPPLHPAEDRRIARLLIEPGLEPGLEWELLPFPLAEIPEAVLPIREPYPWPWLRPLQIASAVLVLLLGGANVLVWQKRRGLSLLGRG
ncbi:MAG: hypothetical protein DDT24_00271 [Chloroflexi bacterium]|nr:hypothetical protein [Chloroflexota bacterium]MBT9165694.1 hypothetical protein [Chloroflexota bacterium]